jgi:hypothetical protein
MSNDPFVQQVLDETRFEQGLIRDASKYRQQRDLLLDAMKFAVAALGADDCPSIPDGAMVRGKMINAIAKVTQN